MVSFDKLPVIEGSEKKITIDFSETRRKSFLPEGFFEPSLKAVRIIECNEEDDLFFYMRSDHKDYEERPLKKFCTGSKYLGEWSKLGIAGKGIYKYPHGVIYDGYFNRKGEFHGTGMLVYPSGQRIEGIWRNGKLNEDCNFITKVGVVMSKNYCEMPDRRFQIELENDLNPVGQEYLTDEVPPPRTIPTGCYDVVEGFFDPKLKTVYAYPKDMKSKSQGFPSENDLMKEGKSSNHRYIMSSIGGSSNINFHQLNIKSQSEMALSDLMMRQLTEEGRVVSWIPSSVQESWIKNNCRKEWDEATGYRPDLYETWTKGNTSQIHKSGEDNSSNVDDILTAEQLLQQENDQDVKFLSFIQYKQNGSEAVTLEMLSKMFLKDKVISATGHQSIK